ncbi:MAG: hypothetical protein CL753_00530 [Chloroflexi bacterium]|nr:hypothetical protein [Chloroflexota bacterium]
MLHMVMLNHTSDNCPGVSIPIRDRVLTMFNTLEEVLSKHSCSLVGSWINKSSHVSFFLVEGPDAHAVDSLIVDFGLAVWNHAVIYPVMEFEQAVTGLPTG